MKDLLLSVFIFFEFFVLICGFALCVWSVVFLIRCNFLSWFLLNLCSLPVSIFLFWCLIHESKENN